MRIRRSHAYIGRRRSGLPQALQAFQAFDLRRLAPAHRILKKIREMWLFSITVALGYYLVVYQWETLSLPRGLRFVDLSILFVGFLGLYHFLCISIEGDLHSRGIGIRSIVLRHANELGCRRHGVRRGEGHIWRRVSRSARS